MVTTAQDLRAAGIEIPLFVGGAALTRKFTATRIAAEYGGPDALRQGRHGRPRPRQPALQRDHPRRAARAAARASRRRCARAPTAAERGRAGGRRRRSRRARRSRGRFRCPRRPTSTSTCCGDVPLTHIFPYLNLQMLLGKHLGREGLGRRGCSSEGDAKAVEIQRVVEELEREAVEQRHDRAPMALYRFFEARSVGRRPDPLSRGGARSRASSSRGSAGGERLCLADYVRDAASRRAGLRRALRGHVRRGRARSSPSAGRTRASTSARTRSRRSPSSAPRRSPRCSTPGCAPSGASRIRRALSLEDKLKAHYRGLRVSFGYPACPNLADQRILFDLLEPAQIGLDLTEGFMMDPEASVSALVFHHPEAKYFKAERRSAACRPSIQPPASARDSWPPRAEGLDGKRVLDVGCGCGAALPARWRPARKHVVGLDRDPRAAIARRPRARAAAGLANVEFHEADVEREEYAPLASPTSSPRTSAPPTPSSSGPARALRPGELPRPWWPFTWTSGGRRARSRASPTTRRAWTRRSGARGLRPGGDRGRARGDAASPPSRKGSPPPSGSRTGGRADGRWFRYIAFLEEGGRTLTRSHLIVKARRS